MFNYRQPYRIWAQWSLQNRKCFSFSDETLPAASVENSPLLCRDHCRGALESCVQPQRPWSKSQGPTSGVGEAATMGAEGRMEGKVVRVTRIPGEKLSILIFLSGVSPVVVVVVVAAGVVPSVGVGVGVVISAGVLVSARGGERWKNV